MTPRSNREIAVTRAAAGTRLAALAVRIAGLLLAVTLAAEQTFRANVHLVTVTATVEDSQGNYVDHLQPENFVLYEDDVRQTIAHFSHSPNAAVSVGILLDLRLNMTRKIKTAIYAIERFVRGLRKDDELFLMTFADTVRVRHEFTTDHAAVLRKLSSLDMALEQRSVSEGLEMALAELGKARIDRRGVLILSDRQTEPPYTNADGFKIRSYVFGKDFVREPAGKDDQPALNAELYVPGRSRELDAFLARVANELRNQYTLAYYSEAPADGRFHSIRVTTTPGLEVEARTGYFRRN
jgi:Ca-activated chloride channel family protein